jgi:hypothetical protein
MQTSNKDGEKRLSRTLPLSQCQIHMYNRQQTLSETVPQGNRTMCCFRSVKVKQNAISLRTRVFHGRKVTTINADDMEYIVEYIKCEVIDNTSHIKKMKREWQTFMHNPNQNKERICQLRQKIKSERDKKYFTWHRITPEHPSSAEWTRTPRHSHSRQWCHNSP